MCYILWLYVLYEFKSDRQSWCLTVSPFKIYLSSISRAHWVQSDLQLLTANTVTALMQGRSQMPPLHPILMPPPADTLK